MGKEGSSTNCEHSSQGPVSRSTPQMPLQKAELARDSQAAGADFADGRDFGPCCDSGEDDGHGGRREERDRGRVRFTST